MCLTPYSCLMLPPVTIGKNTKPFSLFCRLQQWVVRALRWMGHWNTSFPMTKNSTTSEKQGWILLILLTKALPLYKFALYHLCKFTPRNKISLAPLLHAWPKIFQLDGITYSFHSHNIFKSTCNCLFPKSNAWPQKHAKSLWIATQHSSERHKPQNLCITHCLTKLKICMFIKLRCCFAMKLHFDRNTQLNLLQATPQNVKLR